MIDNETRGLSRTPVPSRTLQIPESLLLTKVQALVPNEYHALLIEDGRLRKGYRASSYSFYAPDNAATGVMLGFNEYRVYDAEDNFVWSFTESTRDNSGAPAPIVVSERATASRLVERSGEAPHRKRKGKKKKRVARKTAPAARAAPAETQRYEPQKPNLDAPTEQSAGAAVVYITREEQKQLEFRLKTIAALERYLGAHSSFITREYRYQIIFYLADRGIINLEELRDLQRQVTVEGMIDVATEQAAGLLKRLSRLYKKWDETKSTAEEVKRIIDDILTESNDEETKKAAVDATIGKYRVRVVDALTGDQIEERQERSFVRDARKQLGYKRETDANSDDLARLPFNYIARNRIYERAFRNAGYRQNKDGNYFVIDD